MPVSDQTRVFRNYSFGFYEKDGSFVLGPNLFEMLKVLFIVLMVLDNALLVGAFFLMNPVFFGEETGNRHFMLFVFHSFFITFTFVAAFLYASWEKNRKTRLVFHPNGKIHLKDSRGENIELIPNEETKPEYESKLDEKGREVYDLILKHDRISYYLLSDYSEIELQKFGEKILEKLRDR